MTIAQNPIPVNLADIKQAHQNIASYAHRTPVLTCETLNEMCGHSLFFKCENFQKTGAFKFRGAINAISNLSEEQRQLGVVTHSSGNHAQALAHAAALFGIPSYIVMPTNAPRVKKEAVICYGGKVTECEPTLEDRLKVSAEVQKETGANMVPPFDHVDIVAGQGTTALEFLEQVPNLEFLVTPVGGGGLLSGVSIAAKAISKRLVVIGAEPVGADDVFQSFEAQKLIPQTNPQTIADGLRTSMSRLTWRIIRRNVQRIIRVEEQEIVASMKLFLERTKVLVEPSAAVAIAAAMGKNMLPPQPPRNIGIILTGGNVDLDKLPWSGS